MYSKEDVKRLEDKIKYAVQISSALQGEDSFALAAARDAVSEDPILFQHAMHALYLNNARDTSLFSALLKIMAELNYFDVFPLGLVLGGTALMSGSAQIQEDGLKMFEKWGQLSEYAVLLERLHFENPSLEEYRTSVVEKLRDMEMMKAEDPEKF